MICDLWDVVVVPFPFTEKAGAKRRPALVLSSKAFNENGHTVLAMITTKSHAPWPGDINIEDLSLAGLQLPCIVRLKIFTLDNRLIIRCAGRLAEKDRKSVENSLRLYLLSLS
ncbi:MAG: type II toxin-antitoxin system PemK/MazF family toxin [Deltaproteobacteria bacterium]|nr:type II toxin-antitoxin system PemK/MazF family toxin [Deltaproteobacteria bacterium]